MTTETEGDTPQAGDQFAGFLRIPSIPDPRPRFAVVIEQFQLRMEATRELLASVTPHLQELDLKRLMPEAAANAVDGISEETRAELGSWWRGLFETRFGPDFFDVDDVNKLPPVLAEAIRQRRVPEIEDVTAAELETLKAILSDDPGLVFAFLKSILRTSQGPLGGIILFSALLTTVIASLEVLVSSLVTEHYLRFPSSLEGTEKEFSLQDLAAFSEFEDAKSTAIARRVDNLMRGSLDDWADWFESRVGAKFDRVSHAPEALREAFQRRHLIVHNGGRVSRQYLRNVPAAQGVVEVGDEVFVTRRYLETVLEECVTFGMLLATICWVEWAPEDRPVASARLNEAIYELMKDDAWPHVRHLCQVAQHLKCDDASKNVLRVNEWLAIKRLDGVAEIESDVLNWDTSALSARFRLAKASLLDDRAEQIALIPKLVASGELRPRELFDWPLLAELRQSQEFEGLLRDLPEQGDQTETG